MIYLPGQRAIFFHVPKTGGRFIEQYLRSKVTVQQIGARHSTMFSSGPKVYDKNFMFMFIREPSDWYRSYWDMKMRDKLNGENWYYLEKHLPWHPCWEIDPYCGSNDLDTFVENCGKLNGYLNRMYQQFIGQGRLRVDVICDYSCFVDEFSDVLKILEINHDKDKLAKLPRVNQAKKRSEISEAVKEKINKIENLYYEYRCVCNML